MFRAIEADKKLTSFRYKIIFWTQLSRDASFDCLWTLQKVWTLKDSRVESW